MKEKVDQGCQKTRLENRPFCSMFSKLEKAALSAKHFKCLSASVFLSTLHSTFIFFFKWNLLITSRLLGEISWKKGSESSPVKFLMKGFGQFCGKIVFLFEFFLL